MDWTWAVFGSRRLYIESWKIQDFVSFWENFFGVRVGTERGGGEGVGGGTEALPRDILTFGVAGVTQS